MKKIQVFVTHIVTNEMIETNDVLVEEITFLEKITTYPHETIIVYYSPDGDNSIDEVRDRIPKDVKIVKNDRPGNPYCMPSMRNKVIDLAKDYFVLLHNDVRVSVGWLDSLVADLEKAESIYKDRCVMAPRYVPYHYIPGTIKPKYPEFWKRISTKPDFYTIEKMKEWCKKWHFKFENNMLYSLPPGHITDDGHALMMFISSKKFFDEKAGGVGGNDERYIYRRHDDDDWGITTLMKGGKNLKSQTSLIGHMVHMTLGHKNFSFFDKRHLTNEELFIKKWGKHIFDEMITGKIWIRLHKEQLKRK
jgi:GT2 family glycosyltransferase